MHSIGRRMIRSDTWDRNAGPEISWRRCGAIEMFVSDDRSGRPRARSLCSPQDRARIVIFVTEAGGAVIVRDGEGIRIQAIVNSRRRRADPVHRCEAAVWSGRAVALGAAVERVAPVPHAAALGRVFGVEGHARVSPARRRRSFSRVQGRSHYGRNGSASRDRHRSCDEEAHSCPLDYLQKSPRPSQRGSPAHNQGPTQPSPLQRGLGDRCSRRTLASHRVGRLRDCADLLLRKRQKRGRSPNRLAASAVTTKCCGQVTQSARGRTRPSTVPRCPGSCWCCSQRRGCSNDGSRKLPRLQPAARCRTTTCAS